jgi:dsRNA-specific ribonuclease
VSTSGPPHEQEFRVSVLLDGRALTEGIGSSRQRAEEQAARAALPLLLAEPTTTETEP